MIRLLAPALAALALTGCTDTARPSAGPAGLSGSPAATPRTVPVGAVVDQGRLVVRVVDLRCDAARGEQQDCRLTVSLRNPTALAQSLVHTEQFLVDDRGSQYAPVLPGATRDRTSTALLHPVPPGRTVTGALHFAVPADAVITAARVTEVGRGATDYVVDGGR